MSANMLRRLGTGRFVLDCSNVRNAEGLFEVFSHAKACASDADLQRLVFVANSPDNTGVSAESRMAAVSIQGITKSLGRELGRKGAAINTVYVPESTSATYGDALPPPVEWLSDPAHFRYVTGQGIDMGVLEAHTPAQPSLEGKTVLVTGATGGIGSAICKACAGLGGQVVAVGSTTPRADGGNKGEALMASLHSTPGTNGAHAYAEVDLTRPDGEGVTSDLLQVVRESTNNGALDGVVHCAGATLDKTLQKMPEETWVKSLTLNLINPMHITQGLMDEGALREGAALVAISSIIGFSGNMGQTHYAAAKRGMLDWVRTLPADKLRAYAVAPGTIESAMLAAMPEPMMKAVKAQIAMGALGQADDVADVVAALLSPAGRALKAGQSIRVCGGAFWG